MAGTLQEQQGGEDLHPQARGQQRHAPGAAGALADPLLAGLLVFHGLTASVFSLLLWYSGLRRAPAGLAGVFMAFLPASAAVTAVLFLGEPMTTAHLAGFALMLASLLLATWPARRRA